MQHLKNGITFLILAFIMELPQVILHFLGVIQFISDRDWISNAVAVISIIGILFYIIGVICLIRFFRAKKHPHF